MAQHLLFLALGVSAALAQSTSLDYCQALVDVLSLCEEETSGFTLLPATSQASCLCTSQISTLTWGPQEFDDLASLCASQYATIDTEIASDASALEGFCTLFAADAQITPSSQAASATTSATPGNIIQGTSLTDSGYSTPAGTSAGTSATPAAETPATTPGPTVSYSVVTVGGVTPSANPNSNPAARVDYKGSEQLTGGLLFGLLSYLGYLLV